MSHLAKTHADTMWRFVRTLLKFLFVLGVLAAILAAWVAWRISQMYPEIHPVPAPVAWVTRDVVLSPEAPAVRGRLVLTATSVPTAQLRVGVNAGAPTARAIASPDSLLTGPTVGIATDQAQGQASCFAPCELQVRPEWDCDPGACRLVAGISLELFADAAGAGEVTIGIAGGISANLDDELPPGLEANIELDGDVAPGAS